MGPRRKRKVAEDREKVEGLEMGVCTNCKQTMVLNNRVWGQHLRHSPNCSLAQLAILEAGKSTVENPLGGAGEVKDTHTGK